MAKWEVVAQGGHKVRGLLNIQNSVCWISKQVFQKTEIIYFQQEQIRGIFFFLSNTAHRSFTSQEITTTAKLPMYVVFPL